MLLKTVEVQELKNCLTEYLGLVRGGEEILVTDHGQAVAELRPPRAAQLESRYSGLAELARKGIVRLPAAPNDPSLYKPLGRRLLSHEEVMRLLDEERGER
jgi:antitoxin (DNA-binding transcriptional repressor) of toxin-antitoxin stability system